MIYDKSVPVRLVVGVHPLPSSPGMQCYYSYYYDYHYNNDTMPVDIVVSRHDCRHWTIVGAIMVVVVMMMEWYNSTGSTIPDDYNAIYQMIWCDLDCAKWHFGVMMLLW